MIRKKLPVNVSFYYKGWKRCPSDTPFERKDQPQLSDCLVQMGNMCENDMKLEVTEYRG